MSERWTCAAGLFLVLLAVQGSEAATCTISTTTLNFGRYNVFDTNPVDSTATVTYRCGPPGSPAQNVTVVLTRGQSSTFYPRTLVQGSETLAYNLYLDAARTSVWGDGTVGTQLHFNASAPHNANFTLTIYGRIPASQDVSAGTYTDTVFALINF